MYIIKDIVKLNRAKDELPQEKKSDLSLILPIYNRLGGYIVDSKGVKVENWTEDKKIDAKDVALFEEVKKKKDDKKMVEKKDDK